MLCSDQLNGKLRFLNLALSEVWAVIINVAFD